MALTEPGPPTVFVLRALGLGDLLTAIPALRGLRRAYPGHRLVLGAPPEIGGWLRQLGIVDAVAPTQQLGSLRAPLAPAVAVNLHGSGPLSHNAIRSLRPHRMIAYRCTEAGFEEGPEWDPLAHEVDRWCALVRHAGGDATPEELRLPRPGRGTGPGSARPSVVLHPGAASPSRRWPVTRWREVAAVLRCSATVLVTGSSSDAPLSRAVADGLEGLVDLAGQTDVKGLAELVATSSLVLSGDTGIAHLATAYGTPSVTLFGPISPELWGPVIDCDRHTVLWRGASVHDRGDPHGTELDPRLEAISVGDVLAAAVTLLPVPIDRAARSR